jgi:hypothetical protein
MTVIEATHAGPTRTRPRGPNAWLVLGGIFTVIVIVAGGLSVAGWLGYRTEVQTQVYRQAVTSIDIEVDTGDLTLAPGDAGTVAVTRRLFWSYSKPTIDEQWDGQTLRVTGDCRGWFWLGPGCGVDYTVAVPEGVSVLARTSTGDISVSNIRGVLRLSTSTGDIRVSGAAAALELRTSTGDITATTTGAAPVDASTSTGDIDLRLGASSPDVMARTSTGDIQITVPGDVAYRVQADTSTGDVRVSVSQDDRSTYAIRARASTGDIDIRPS